MLAISASFHKRKLKDCDRDLPDMLYHILFTLENGSLYFSHDCIDHLQGDVRPTHFSNMTFFVVCLFVCFLLLLLLFFYR